MRHRRSPAQITPLSLGMERPLNKWFLAPPASPHPKEPFCKPRGVSNRHTLNYAYRACGGKEKRMQQTAKFKGHFELKYKTRPE